MVVEKNYYPLTLKSTLSNSIEATMKWGTLKMDNVDSHFVTLNVYAYCNVNRRRDVYITHIFKGLEFFEFMGCLRNVVRGESDCVKINLLSKTKEETIQVPLYFGKDDGGLWYFGVKHPVYPQVKFSPHRQGKGLKYEYRGVESTVQMESKRAIETYLRGLKTLEQCYYIRKEK